MPVILGPDGPSLGGFVCPAVVAAARAVEARPAARPATACGSCRGRAPRRRPPTSDGAAGWPAPPTRSSPSPARRGTPAPARRPITDDGRAGPAAARRRPPRRSPTARPATGSCSSSTAPMTLDLALRLRVAGARPVGRRAPPGRRRRRDPGRALAARPGRRRRADRRGRPLELLQDAEAELVDVERRRVPVADRAPAAVVGRPRDPRGDRPLHARRARRRAVVPVEHRVHPPHQRPRHRRRRAAHRVRRLVPRARARRRLPRCAGRHAARSPPPAGHDEVQPGPHLDAGERRRHRRRLPLHLRHGGTRRLPVRRAHRAGVEPRRPRPALRPSPGCCGRSTSSAGPPGQRRRAARPARGQQGAGTLAHRHRGRRRSAGRPPSVPRRARRRRSTRSGSRQQAAFAAERQAWADDGESRRRRERAPDRGVPAAVPPDRDRRTAAAGDVVDRVDAAMQRIRADGREAIWITLLEPAAARAAAADVDRRLAAGEHLPLAGAHAGRQGQHRRRRRAARRPAARRSRSSPTVDGAGRPRARRRRRGGRRQDEPRPVRHRSGRARGRPTASAPTPTGRASISGGSSSGLGRRRGGRARRPRARHRHRRLGPGAGRLPTASSGVKPTRGRISTAGVVPACRSLDCVSVFARTVEEAALGRVDRRRRPTTPTRGAAGRRAPVAAVNGRGSRHRHPAAPTA